MNVKISFVSAALPFVKRHPSDFLLFDSLGTVTFCDHMICEWLLTICTKMIVDICTWRTRIGQFHLSSKSSRTRNKRKPLAISPLTLLCITWLMVSLSLFACRQMKEVSGACSLAHNNTNDKCTTL